MTCVMITLFGTPTEITIRDEMLCQGLGTKWNGFKDQDNGRDNRLLGTSPDFCAVARSTASGKQAVSLNLSAKGDKFIKRDVMMR